MCYLLIPMKEMQLRRLRKKDDSCTLHRALYSLAIVLQSHTTRYTSANFNLPH